jgi:TetR/AcrR family transcriptional repressor of lmrAB and yxaGH operons
MGVSIPDGVGLIGRAPEANEGHQMSDTKDRLVVAALDLLRQSGLAGAGINNVVDVSGAPKGSVYHFFPGGKHDLVASALTESERQVGDGLRKIFGTSARLAAKVRDLFSATASTLESNGFTKSCPVGAVTLDLASESENLRHVCGAIFDTWRDIVAEGLTEVPHATRREVAELVLATLEGAMILARARASKDPLLCAGGWLADALQSTFPVPPRTAARPRTPLRRRRRSPS